MFGAQGGFGYFGMLGGGGQSTQVQVLQAGTIGCAEHGANIEGAADVVEQDFNCWARWRLAAARVVIVGVADGGDHGGRAAAARASLPQLARCRGGKTKTTQAVAALTDDFRHGLILSSCSKMQYNLNMNAWSDGFAPVLLAWLAFLGGLLWLLKIGFRRGRLFWGMVALTGALGVVTVLVKLQLWGGAWLMLDGVLIACAIAFPMMLQRLRRQRAEIDRLERIVEARSDRVTALGHEIRTPLAMIKGASDLLLEGKPGPLTEHQLNFVRTVNQNCEQMILLAEDLLVQARIEAGLFKLRLERLDLKDLIYRIVKDARTIAEQRGQTIRIDAPQVMTPVHVDPRLIRQAMMNLLTNASRHTSHGGHIYVSLAENDDRVVVSVMDDGAGMSAEEKNKLFQRFSSGRPLGDGTGMGLVITRQIIELHGGIMMVDTTLGKGTMFLFSIPRLQVDDER